MSELLDQKPIAATWRNARRFAQDAENAPAEKTREPDDQSVYELIELFFFAYRDFVGDADRLLGAYGFGRAHHRVLHFVHRRPGLPIAALLDILKITKQSLNRVLKQLLNAGFVEARAGADDRRQRLLYLTPRGEALARELTALQSGRFLRVLGELRPDARAAATDFLFAIIDEGERERVHAHLASARQGMEETP